MKLNKKKLKELRLIMKNNMLSYEQELYNKGIKYIAGVDEVGRGPLVGPVVTAAVILPVGYFNGLINDSKKLSEKRRNEFLHQTV